MATAVLGISAYYHDSAAALLLDGQLLAAAQEERFSRIKNDAAFPTRAVDFCLAAAGLQPEDLTAVVFYDKPLVKFERLLSTTLATAPAGFGFFRAAMPTWIREKLWIPGKLRKAVPGAGEYLFSSHHLSHAAAAFYPSPFERAAILTVDGVGEWSTCSYGTGRQGVVSLDEELRFPHSLGLLYSAFTAYLGFRVNEGEYKVMGLAPYGRPRFAEVILDKLMQQKGDGSFTLDMRYFGFLSRLCMTNERFHQLFGGPPRLPDAELEERHLDIAASIQLATEELMLGLVRQVHAKTGESRLCLAGGVALNSVANGRLLREGPFKEIWIQPAAGDAGAALGAAYLGHLASGGEVSADTGRDSMRGALLGPEFSALEIEEALTGSGLKWSLLEESALLEKTAAALAAGRIGGWFQGRMEFGPRALGSRSILADARVANMQHRLNMKIKFREGFRPFAPAVLAERAGEYFDLAGQSPYMLLVCPVAENQRIENVEVEGLARLKQVRSQIPAVTHVDNSARVQTVDGERNPLFYALLKHFEAITGCPMLVNTSFNVKDEPIVCNPEDALRCFVKTDIDFLAIGNYWVEKV
ncbi:putative carbamoyl transferase, NodU family [Desulfuromonas soudanensis]|uniref:Putative carbamoyl transferase, NodU family n=1 Tax=Desulfuromonas soudanensis TaxID=1603606 RepID=A0A0M4DFX3_9BACT|nr:carbamoyltransferase N-terminal domain-containing protein [Desulfuromonas soudanensis]ALC15457.1 putative carbamoyl transferase, NodU family [Desulfuromonas soudanensis]